jgi:hypothetical protein
MQVRAAFFAAVAKPNARQRIGRGGRGGSFAVVARRGAAHSVDYVVGR